MPSIGEGEEPVLEGWERLETSTGIPYYSKLVLLSTRNAYTISSACCERD
jgi:hypothetical protein